MAQLPEVTKLYNTFVKGLITEATPLTFPPNASGDEDNCLLFQKGNRTRRLGIDFEDGYEISFFDIQQSDTNNQAIHDFRWDAPNNTTESFLCLQVGSQVRFYNLSSGPPYSPQLKSFSIDLTNYTAPFASDAAVASNEVSMSSGKGFLFIASPVIEPVIVEYDPDLDEIEITRVYIQIRDFKGLDDGLSPEDEPDSLSNEHYYNLKNQGWNSATYSDGALGDVQFFNWRGQPVIHQGIGDYPITQYFSSKSVYPPNNRQWFNGQDTTTGDLTFLPDLLAKYSTGNTVAPRGHFILNAFNKGYSEFSGVPDLTAEGIAARPKSNAFWAGRVWYACQDTLYFSQVLDDKRQAGMCYQVADPTDQNINKLVANDGGVIPIPEMGDCIRLFPIGTGLIILSPNGTWFVSGGQSGFSADDFSVSKISPIGMSSPNSVIEVDHEIYWWSDTGILGLSQKTGIFGPVQSNFDKLNITQDTIQSFYFDDISVLSKKYVKSVYDAASNTIQWLFKTSDNSDNWKFDRALCFDLNLKAFYPWTFTCFTDPSPPSAAETPYICGAFASRDINIISGQNSDRKNTFLNYIFLAPVGTSYHVTIGLLSNPQFVDWFAHDISQGFDSDEAGRDFSSYMETGYEIAGDALREKQAPWLKCYFRQTEKNFVLDGSDYDLDFPSSCLFTAKWNWSDSKTSNQWKGPYEVYRLLSVPSPDSSNLALTTGFPIVTTRFKIRGRGKALQFRFESSSRKDFDLYGWEVIYNSNAVA